jgi:lysozyme family protein
MAPYPMGKSAREIIDEILRREGSTYTDHPQDNGGPTRWGITLGTLQRSQPGATADDVRNLQEHVARAIYESEYILNPGFDRVPDPWLRGLLVDFGVTSGPERAIEALQRSVGVTEDGILGPATKAALLNLPPTTVYARVLREYFKHFANVVATNPTQIRWLRGWINRACEFIR